MNFTTSLALVFAATLPCAMTGCRPSTIDDGGLPPKAAPQAPAAEPTAARVMQRSQERWNKGMKNNADGWIAAYDYLVPEGKRDMPLGKFLGNMSNHKYENMRVVEVLAVKDDKAYTRVVGLWTPLAPEVQHVKLGPGETLTQEIQMIESWRWVDGDWCYVRPQRDTDFFADHPELLKKSSDGDKPNPVPPSK